MDAHRAYRALRKGPEHCSGLRPLRRPRLLVLELRREELTVQTRRPFSKGPGDCLYRCALRISRVMQRGCLTSLDSLFLYYKTNSEKRIRENTRIFGKYDENIYI